jgi:Ca2+:H+ antiporter
MIITSMALVLPSVLFATLKQTNKLGGKIRFLSQVTAVALLVIYVIFLYFQLGSHKEIFLGEENDLDVGHDESENRREDHEVSEQEPEQEDRPEAHSQALWMAVIVLVTSALAIMACSFYFIDNLDATAESIHVSQTFIAMIIIPISSNAPEASALIMASQKKRINYAIGVIVGSILQVALFVLPILVIIGSAIHKPMTLYFETSQTSILFLAVLMVNHLLQDGNYTYLHGIMLLSL